MAGVVVTMTGDEARLYRAMQKVVKQQDKLSKKVKESGQVSEAASRKAVAGFERSRSAVDNYTASVSAMTAGVMLAVSAQAKLNAEQQKGMQSAKALEDSNKRMLQVSSSGPEFAQNQAQADALAVKYGLTRDQARDLSFQANSGGFQDSQEFIARASVVIDPSTAAMIATKFPEMFKGVKAEDAIKLTEYAAKNSPLSFEQMAAVAPTVAQGMAMLGASMEEALGAESVLAKRFKGNGEQVADALRSFTSGLGIKGDFQGKGFIGAFDALQAMPEADRKKILGESQELNVAYQVIGEEIADIVAATKANSNELQRIQSGGGLLMEQIAIAENDPLISSMREAIRAQVLTEVATEQKSAITGFRVQASKSYAERAMLEGSLMQRTLDSGLKDVVSNIPVVGGFLGGLVPDSNSQYIAAGLTNLGMDPKAAGEYGSGLSLAATDPSGIVGVLNSIAASQIQAAKSMEDSAKKMADSVERSSINSNTSGARAQAAAAGN